MDSNQMAWVQTISDMPATKQVAKSTSTRTGIGNNAPGSGAAASFYQVAAFVSFAATLLLTMGDVYAQSLQCPAGYTDYVSVHISAVLYSFNCHGIFSVLPTGSCPAATGIDHCTFKFHPLHIRNSPRPFYFSFIFLLDSNKLVLNAANHSLQKCYLTDMESL